MVFNKNSWKKTFFIVKMTGPAMVRPVSSDFWKAPLARYIFQTPQTFNSLYHMLIIYMGTSLCRTLSFPSQFSQGLGSFTTAFFPSYPPFSFRTGTFVQLCNHFHVVYLMVTIYLVQPEFIPRRSFLFLCILMYLYNSNHLYYGTTLDQVAFLHQVLGCGTTVFLSIKKSDREVQPLAALYPTVRLSHWRQVRKNILSRVWTPGTTLSLLHPGGPPLLVPLSSCDWEIWASPTETDQDSCPGWLPLVPLDLVPPPRPKDKTL